MSGGGRWAFVLALTMAAWSVSVATVEGQLNTPIGDFPSIQTASDPEDFLWEVKLGEEQELRRVDEQTVAVAYSTGQVSFLISAPKAHDAKGAPVPTSIAISGENTVTVTVHHRAGNPANAFVPFAYPVASGEGWDGNYQPGTVPMPSAEPPPQAAGVPAAGLGPGVVALVTGVDRDLGTITVAELRRVVSQLAAAGKLPRSASPAPRPDKDLRIDALWQLLEYAYLNGEAAERGIEVTATEVSKRHRAVVRTSFGSYADYRAYLKARKLTVADALERIRNQILNDRIVERIVKGTTNAKAAEAALNVFGDEYSAKWRARTTCAPQYLIRQCSNGPRG